MSESWIARWQEGRIGWHEAAGNRSLKRHWRWRDRYVLVPMCGKSVDLLWLESFGNRVVGVELSDIAVRTFFEENAIGFRRSDSGRRFDAIDRRVTIYCDDYFEFDAGPFDAHYDRGALVALPDRMRERYAGHTSALLSDDARQLVISIEYDESIAEGPPFSVPGSEIVSYWPSLEPVDAYDDIENGPPKFREAGLERMIETVWRTADAPTGSGPPVPR